MSMMQMLLGAGRAPIDGGGSVRFDGSGDYIYVPADSDLDLSGDFTIEFFYKFHTAPNTYVVLINMSVNNTGSYSGETSLYYTSGGTWISTPSSVSGTVPEADRMDWVHIAWTRSGSSSRLFINGSLVDTDTSSITMTTGYNWYMGDRPPSAVNGNYPINGWVSNWRIIKGTALYTSSFTKPALPLEDVTNTKLLCCKSEDSATAAVVSPTTIVAGGDATASSDNPFT